LQNFEIVDLSCINLSGQVDVHEVLWML